MYIFHIAGVTGIHHHTQLFIVEIESLQVFAYIGLEP
jgi:hypothetical protein